MPEIAEVRTVKEALKKELIGRTIKNISYRYDGIIKSDKKEPENMDLVVPYYKLRLAGYNIDLRYVKGHAGHKWNEVADKLATGMITVEEVMKTYGKDN